MRVSWRTIHVHPENTVYTARQLNAANFNKTIMRVMYSESSGYGAKLGKHCIEIYGIDRQPQRCILILYIAIFLARKNPKNYGKQNQKKYTADHYDNISLVNITAYL
jgi:hypothetical protein